MHEVILLSILIVVLGILLWVRIELVVDDVRLLVLNAVILIRYWLRNLTGRNACDGDLILFLSVGLAESFLFRLFSAYRAKKSHS